MEFGSDSSFEVVHCCEGLALGRLGVSLTVLWSLVVVYASVEVGGSSSGMQTIEGYIHIPFLLI